MCETLAVIPLGKEAEVRAILTPEPIRNRLNELGLTVGCRVRCIYAAACGDPRAYLVRGPVLAIRNRDARCIEVKTWD